jgi:hypothetical protein
MRACLETVGEVAHYALNLCIIDNIFVKNSVVVRQLLASAVAV